MRDKPIDICRHCVDDDWMDQFFSENDYKNFNAEYCITRCKNDFVPKYLPASQVIKYLKATAHAKNAKIRTNKQEATYKM